MTDYIAPLRDMRFILRDVFNAPALWARLPALAERIDADTADAILEEAAKVTGQLIAPLSRNGDEQGVHFEAGRVSTPDGFREAWRIYREGGWVGLGATPSMAAWACRRCLACCLKRCSTPPTAASACIPP
jgi:hypothetical protein